MKGKTRAESGIQRISETSVGRIIPATHGTSIILETSAGSATPTDYATPAGHTILAGHDTPAGYATTAGYDVMEFTQVLTGKKNEDGTIELRADSVVRDKPKTGEARGVVNIRKTKAKAHKMINSGEGGIRMKPGRYRKPRKTAEERKEEKAQLMLKLSGMQDYGNAIKMNLLTKSGLSDNRVMRDLNILESSVNEAARHMRADGLLPPLNHYFELDRLRETNSTQADGCTVAALLIMNAAMLHQRISNGGWLPGISDLSLVKNEVNVVRKMSRQWERIMRHDFLPVFEPALEVIYAIETTGKIAGLERALHHLTAEAERIAETYADMGSDHAGPLFNRVMGNQASDGAFFTRPVAASLSARLTLDVCGDLDWSDPNVWKDHKTVDLACGSGTLLAAMLSDMKRRAANNGADTETLTRLQKLVVEDVIKGLDINPVSLQLAASQLTAGNHRVSYRRMGLHQMPYGPDKENPDRVSVGTLELLGQSSILSRRNQLDLGDDTIDSQATWALTDRSDLEDAVEAAGNARIVIMNPPFTNRVKMGEKFPKETQHKLRSRVDAMEDILINTDEDMNGFVDKNSVSPLFVALADYCLEQHRGILTMVLPTIALTNPSGGQERLILAQRYHIHTVVTCHQPANMNMSQNTNINESIVVMSRHAGAKPPTRFINLDRMPANEGEVADFHRCLLDCEEGLIANGWGEISYWYTECIDKGDWTAAVWRSPVLTAAAMKFANYPDLHTIGDTQNYVVRSSRQRVYENFEIANQSNPAAVPILSSKGADSQKTIESTPDSFWIAKDGRERQAEHYLKWSSNLLITAGQDNSTARLTAVAADKEYLGGGGWLPVAGISVEEAKPIAVFINSTPGRLQLMRNFGRKLAFPLYTPRGIEKIRIPNIEDKRIRNILSDCWERTKNMVVPQFRDGECEVRRLWDEAVAEVMDWDADELTRLRLLLHQEPHVRGLGYGQYADEMDI